MSELNIFELLFDEGKRVVKILKKDRIGSLRCERDMYKKYYEKYLGKGFPPARQRILEQLEYENYKMMYEEIASKKSDVELENIINNERGQTLKRSIFKAELDRRNNGK